METSKAKEKTTEQNKKKRQIESSRSSAVSAFSSDTLGSRNEKEKYQGSSSFAEELSSSAFTVSSVGERGRYKTSSLMREQASSYYSDSDPSGSRKSNKTRQRETKSSGYMDNSGVSSDAKRGTSSEAKRGISSDAKPGVSSDAKPGVSSDAKSRVSSDAKSRVSSDIQSSHAKERNIKPKNHPAGEMSVFAANIPQVNFQTNETYTSNASNLPSSDQSDGATLRGKKENIRLMPFKVKDVMEMLKDNPVYKDKSPVMIKVKENDIDQILEGKHVIRAKAEPLDEYLQPLTSQVQVVNESGSFRMSTGAESGRSKISRGSTLVAEKPMEPPFGGRVAQKVFAMPEVQAFPAVVETVPSRRRGSRRRRPRRNKTPPRQPTPIRRSVSRPGSGKRARRRRSRPMSRSRSRRRRLTPVRGVPRGRRTRVRRRIHNIPLQQRMPLYISPCTAYPMCEDPCSTGQSPYRTVSRRISSRLRTSPVASRGHLSEFYADNARHPYARVPRRVGSRVYTHANAGSVSGPYAGGPRRVVSTGYNTPYYAGGPRRVVSTGYNTPYYATSTAQVSRGPSRNYNNPFTSHNTGAYYPDNVSTKKCTRGCSRRFIGSRASIAVTPQANCCCTMCEEKLKFIQPGLCAKRKNVWTNEYAVIPKPQVQLIDPCEELDPSIYPRADNPCIRDGQGNPLTDCIGRPLRSPIGKKFLNFTANGSVMETSIRGNFWTGQPPLCVKCEMPNNSCGQDTTHSWWMSCGYPIMPDMSPFYNRVLAAQMGPC